MKKLRQYLEKKQIEIAKQDSYDRTIRYCFQFFLMSIVVIAIYGGLVFGFFILTLYGLCPMVTSQTTTQVIDQVNIAQISFKYKGNIVVYDSDDCSSELYGACIESKCEKSSIQTDFEENCELKLKLSQQITFQKLIIHCEQGRCDLLFNSKNFQANNLYIYGEEVYLQGNVLKSNNLFFDSDKGNIKIQSLHFDNAFLNNNKGDIAIQTPENVKLNTITKDQTVCVTSKQNWKDQNTIASDIADVMIKKDETLGECLKVFPITDHQFDKMVELNKHPLFDSLVDLNTSNNEEIRCYYTNNLLLMNTLDNPSTVLSFKNLFVSTSEGNVYINVLQNNEKIGRLLQNNMYSVDKIKLSPTSQSQVKNSLKKIYDSKKLNEIVYLDFRQGLEYFYKLQFIVVFSQMLFNVTPKWIALLSFNIQSSVLQKIDVTLTPGICPYIFDFEQFSPTQAIDQRSSLIKDIITSFEEEIEVKSYRTLSRFDFARFNAADPTTYPNVSNENFKGTLITFCVGFIIIFLISATILFIILRFIVQFQRNYMKERKNQEQERIFFLLFQQQTYVSEIPKIENKSECGSSDDNQKNKLLKNSGYEESNLQLKMDHSFKNYQQTISFSQQLVELMSTILQKTANSLEFFCKNMFIEIEIENYEDILKTQKMIQMDLSEFNKLYQLFCYAFRLQEECLFDDKSLRIMQSLLYSFTEDYVVDLSINPISETDQNEIRIDEQKVKQKDNNQQQIDEENKQFSIHQSEITVAEYFLRLDHQNKRISTHQFIDHPYEQYEAIQGESKEQEEKYLINTNQEGLIKKSKKIIVARKPLSRYIISEQFVNNLFYLFKYEMLRDQNILFENQVDDRHSACNKTVAKEMKCKIDQVFINHLILRRSYQKIIEYISQGFKYLSLILIYYLSPIIFVIPMLAFIFIYISEENKKDRALEAFPVASAPYGINDLLLFRFSLSSMVMYLLIICVPLLYLQIIIYNMFFATSIAKSPLKTSVNNQKFDLEEKKRPEFVIQSVLFVQNFIIKLILFLQILYFMMVYITMVIGSLIYPNVQLPTFIFTTVLVGVLISKIITFKEQYEEGSNLMKNKFKENFFQKFNDLKEQKENLAESDEKKNQKEFKTTLKKKKSLLQSLQNLIDELPFKSNSKRSLKSASKDKKTDYIELSSKITFNLDFNKEDEYTEMFQSIDGNNNKIIDEEMISQFFKDLGMNLSIIQINQAFAHIKVKQQKADYFIKGKEYKSLNFKEFKMFVNYIFTKKVQKALTLLNISYDTVFFSITSTLINSLIIGYFIYSVFYSLSSSSSSFDFSSNSIISLGGILGIILSSKDTNILKQEELIQSAIDKVEKMYHSYNE